MGTRVVRWSALVAIWFGTRCLGAETLPLIGEWRFALDRATEQHEIFKGRGPAPALPEGDGIRDKWFQRDLPDRIKLPGILQSQGYGDDITATTPWVLTLGDGWWKLQSSSLREKFSQPGKVEVPFLSQPPKHYLGVAWYQRDVDIPNSWRGQRAELFLERAHWETRVWIDNRAYTPNQSLVAPHTVDLGTLTPGKHRITIRVDNRQLLQEPIDDEHALDGHSVSDALGASWNGIVGRIELRTTSPVWIEDAQIFPRAATKSALIRLKIGNATGKSGIGKIKAGTKTESVTWDARGGQAEIEVPLGAKALLWDEFHPELQHVKVQLTGPEADDTQTVTFGLREISFHGKELLVNGRVVNLRLNHFGGDFPLTGSPAMDVPAWEKIFRVCQSYGLNGMRFHSWCPPEAAFVAADKLGFYLQPECGLWSPFYPGSVYTEFLEAETQRLLHAFGNHPSFILLSPSNEPGGHYQQVTPAWAARWYTRDNRRLYSAGTGWSDPAQVYQGEQYAALVRFGHGQLRNVTGWFGQDYRTALEGVSIPVLSHEVGQWCAYPDFDVIKEFTGYLQPSNYHIFKYIAEQAGVLPYNHAFAWASGRFQLACYKEEIEANFRTPGLSGYELLDLHDYLGQGTALIGVVDAFWKSKSYVTASEFRRFNGPTIPLARLERRTFTASDTLNVPVELYHFGEDTLHGAVPYWKILDRNGTVIAGGVWPRRDFAVGKNLPLGSITFNLSKLPTPAAYRLISGLQNTEVENTWNFWVYPAQVDALVPPAIFVTQDWSAATQHLAKGEKVLFTPAAGDLDPLRCPEMKTVPVFWNIQMTVRPPRNPTPRFDAMLGLLCDDHHPALAGFPTEANCDWQWTPLIDHVRSINLDDAPRSLKPIVAAIDDWNRDFRLGVIFECKVGAGLLLVSAIDITHPNLPGAQQLRRSLLDYMATKSFRPQITLTPEQAGQLWPHPNADSGPRQHRFDRDLDDGSPARSDRPKKQ